MRDFIGDFCCFFLLTLILEACAQKVTEADWGNFNYVQDACEIEHTASDDVCHPHEDHGVDIGRGRGGSAGGAKR